MRALCVAVVLCASFAHVHLATAATTNGLVAAYSFDRNGSTVVDESGNGNTAAVTNASWTPSGRHGGAFSFDGVSSLISVADSPSLDLTTGMTLEAWVDPAVSDSNWRAIMMKEQPGMLVYSLYANAGGKSAHGEVYLASGSDIALDAPSALPAATWTHLALTFDGASLRLFVNGTQVKKVTAAGSLLTSGGALRLGGDAVWGEYFKGLIDDVRVYNRALGAAEIQADLNAPVQGNGLVAAYSFDQSGAAVADASGSGNAGTVSGASWTSGGRYGGAYAFDGTSSFIVVPDSPSLDLTSGMTLEAWIDPAASTSWRNVLMKEQPGMLVYSLYASGGTAAPRGEVYLSGGTDVGVNGPSALPSGVWTHLAETFDGTTLALYVNGQLAASAPASGSLLTSGGDLRIGGDSVWGEWFAGLIDEVRIYNRALSAGELQTDMATGIATPGPGTADTTPPTAPSGLASTGSTPSSVSLAWSASSDDTAVAGYGIYVNGSRSATTGSPSAVVTGLTCGTTYTLGVDAYDAAGNRSARTSITAATAACGDTTPPSTPTALAATGTTQTSISVSWTASTDNVGVAGYTPYVNGTAVAATTGTAYTAAGLACGTSYTIAVDAFDAAGNHSLQATTTAATQACSSGGAQVFVAPNGSDANACTASAPCLTWNRAYRVALPGQTVQIAGGTYAGQSIAVDSSKTSATQDVTFVRASGATVTLTGDLQILGSHVHVVGPIATDQHHKLLIDSIGAPQRTHNVTVENFSGEDFVIGPASFVTVLGGSFGPSVGCQDSGEYENKISASNALPGVAPDHITIDGVTLHDQTTSNSVSCHNGGLNIVGSTYLTIQNSKWFKDMVYDIEFDDFTGSFPLHDVLIQNNWFDAPTGALDGAGGCQSNVNCAGEADVQVKWNGVAAQNWLVRFNSFANGFAPEWGGAPPSYTNFRIVGNAGGNAWNGSKWMACAPAGKAGVTIAYNAWAGMDNLGSAPASAACSSTDVNLGPVTNYATTSLPYVNPSVTSPDFHLKPGTKAENLVTPTGADYALGTDIDGATRSVPRDAGSDDH